MFLGYGFYFFIIFIYDLSGSPYLSSSERPKKGNVFLSMRMFIYPSSSNQLLLSRHITKTFGLQQPFSTAISSEICRITSHHTNNYRDYSEVITKLGACIENFPTGVEALRMCETEVARYLKESLDCCVATLRY